MVTGLRSQRELEKVTENEDGKQNQTSMVLGQGREAGDALRENHPGLGGNTVLQSEHVTCGMFLKGWLLCKSGLKLESLEEPGG